MSIIGRTGRPWEDIERDLGAMKGRDFSWSDGRMFLFYYYLDDALMQVQQKAYTAYWYENNQTHKAFPSLGIMEGDVIRAGVELASGGPEAWGTFTSGGSESIFLAMTAARNRGRSERGIDRPNVVLPRTAHPTFDRACHYLGIEVRRVPTRGADYRVDLEGMRARMDADTVAVVGSAPNYPFGVFDQIEEIAAMAAAQGVWMHVDACVGGFLAPWVRRLGHDIPPYDFAVEGVMSMSADIHKYGLAAKGASLLLVRDKALMRHHLFEFEDWERGPYASYTTQGTRPAGAVAAAWSVLSYLGEEGYLRAARIIMDTKEKLVSGLNAIPGLRVLDHHQLSIIVYTSDAPDLDMTLLADRLTEMGWFVGRQAEPRGVHIALNPSHAMSVGPYLHDVAAAVDQVRGATAGTSDRVALSY